MRGFDAKDESDVKELARLNCAPWMVEALALNPGYVSWGPHEDYMWVKGEGWHTPILKDKWKDLGIELNELNEVVNFYFYLHRDSKQCETCGGNGYHPDAQWVSESWYSHSSPFTHRDAQQEMVREGMNRMWGSFREREILGHDNYPSPSVLAKYGPGFRAFCEEMRIHGSWSDRITQEEVDVLVKEGRLRDYGKNAKKVTADEVNAAQGKRGAGFLSHDAINRCISVRTRLERFGIPVHCDVCEGHGETFTSPAGRLGVVLWLIHPRKGASRGVEVKEVREDELPAVREFLCAAARRNAERFAKVVG